jgi:small conductance mechanosensitive channel
MGENANAVKDWFLVSGADFAVNLVVFLLILFVGRYVIRATLGVTRRALHRAENVSEILERFIINILHKVLWLILIMIALPKLGVNVAPLIAGLGVGGFIIGFAFQESLGNLAAGLMLMVNQPYALGDYVQAGGVSGTVKEMNMMATIMTTPDNKKVTVPNRQIWGSEIINYSGMPTRRVDLVIGISYHSNIADAIRLIQGVLKSHEQVLDDPEPTIAVSELADSSVNLVVRPWCQTGDYWNVYFGVTRQIKETFDREGIEIPFPQLDLHVQDLPQTT